MKSSAPHCKYIFIDGDPSRNFSPFTKDFKLKFSSPKNIRLILIIQRPLEKKVRHYKAPHRVDLCSMCEQLGFDCTTLKSEDKKVAKMDNEHAQFNKLVSSMKRMNVKNDHRSIGAGDCGAILASASRGRAVY